MSERSKNGSVLTDMYNKLTQLSKLKLKGQPVESRKATSLTSLNNPIRKRIVGAAYRHMSKYSVAESKIADKRSIYERNVRVKVSKILCPLDHILRNIIYWFTAPLISGPIAFAVLGFLYKMYVLPLNLIPATIAFWPLVIVVFFLVLLRNACNEHYCLIEGSTNGITEDDYSEMMEQLPWNLCEPEVESANWVNQILAKYWSLINASFQQYMKSTVDKNGFFTDLESWFGFSNEFTGFRPITVSLGEKSPEITGVHVLKRGLKRNHVIIDLDITYDGDINILLSAFYKLNVTVEQIYARIFLRIIIGPLIRETPTVATISFTLFKRPVISWKFNDILRCLNSSLLQSFVENYLYGLFGNPNKFESTIAINIPNREVKLQQPGGVFRVDVIQAVQLPRMDYFGNPNPYCEVVYENERKRTQVVSGSLNPEWQRSFIFLFTGDQKSNIEFYLYDEDIPKDDLIARFTVAVDLFRQTEKGYNGRMFSTPVRDMETGHFTKNGATRLCFRISYFELSSNIETLRMSANLARKNLPLAVLSILIDYATGLETVAHQVKSPELRSLVRVSVGNQAQVTSIQERTGYPVWEESLNFFLFDPHLEDVHIEVVDMYYVTERKLNINVPADRKKGNRDWVDLSRLGTVVGFVTLPVVNVINAFEMKTANIYQLDGFVEDGNIRVLTSMRFTVDSKTVIENHEKPQIAFPEEDKPIEETDKNQSNIKQTLTIIK